MPDAHEFPDITHLLKLAEGTHFKIRKAKEIVESLSDNILDYLKQSEEVKLFNGLRNSIENYVSSIMTPSYSIKKFE